MASLDDFQGFISALATQSGGSPGVTLRPGGRAEPAAMLPKGWNVRLKSPTQAVRNFGMHDPKWQIGPVPNHVSAPRPKMLFYVRFVPSFPPANPEWEKGLGFAVKSVDRPTVQAEVQELTQYNKKRQVYTSVKYQPVNLTLYDTVDGQVFRFWADYSQFYFGDQRQPHGSPLGAAELTWAYDATLPFQDAGHQGFGYQPILSGDPSGVRTHFLARIEIYQFFGRSFTQCDLINPKITSFAPDELDYETAQPATVRLSVAYDAAIWQNDGLPISFDPFNGPTQTATGMDVSAMFDNRSTASGGSGDGRLAGDTIEPQPVSVNETPRPPKRSRGQGVPAPLRRMDLSEYQTGVRLGDYAVAQVVTADMAVVRSAVASAQLAASVAAARRPPPLGDPGTGFVAKGAPSALSPYGNVNFGGGAPLNTLLSRLVQGDFSNLAGGLLGAAGQSTLSQAVSSQHPLQTLAGSVLSGLPGPLGGIAATKFDQATGAVGVGSSPMSGIRSPSVGQSIGTGLAAAVLSGMVSGNQQANAQIGRSAQGVTMSDALLANLNSTRPPQFPIGTTAPAWVNPDTGQVPNNQIGTPPAVSPGTV